MENTRVYRIGELAAQAGLTPDAVRYYERLKLLPKPARTNGGFRVYTAETFDRLRFIKQAQTLGLTLDEIRELVTFTGEGGHRCRRVHDLVQAKLADLEARMAELRVLRRTLKESQRVCERVLSLEADPECPVVDELSGRR